MIKMHKNLMFKQLSLTTITNVLRRFQYIYLYFIIYLLLHFLSPLFLHLLFKPWSFVIKKSHSCNFFTFFFMFFKCIFHHVILANLNQIMICFVKCWKNINFVTISFFSKSTCFKCEFIYVVIKPKCGISWINVNAISCIVHLGWVFVICDNALSKWKV
jgi:hypothetical protein